MPPRIPTASILLLALFFSSPLYAEADELVLDPIIDSFALSSGLVLTVSIEALAHGSELRTHEPGDPDELSWPDRRIAQGSSAGRDGDRLASDVLLISAAAAVLLKPALTGLEEGARQGWLDLGIYAEVVLINGALTELVKIAVRRPRPIAYIRAREGTWTQETDLSLSFYSGHTSTVASVGAAMTYLEFFRNGCTPRPWITMGAWTAATVATGTLRVTSRSHFITDVLVGAALGTGIGLLVPHLHRRRTVLLPTAAILQDGATVGVASTY